MHSKSITTTIKDRVRTKPERTLVERMAERWAHVPTEERERIPEDGAKNVDHYLYGAPKER